jgi:aspartate racemase
MKTLGLIGGTSWVSTMDYYKAINEGINEILGGLNFAKCIIYSFNYADIKRNNDSGDWGNTQRMVNEAGLHLQNSGAEAIILCAVTMHISADQLQKELNIPIVHIAEITAREIKKAGLVKIGLLGTEFTMEYDFFKSRLVDQGIEVIIPKPDDRQFIHSTIFDEMGKGIFSPQTKKRYLSIISDLTRQGAEGIILGCTELPLLIEQSDINVPVFDVIALHARAAVATALEDSSLSN